MHTTSSTTRQILNALATMGLAMCLMLFLGIKGACIAVGVALVLGVIFVLVCRSKKRKIALAPAISLGVIAAFIAKDALLLLGIA